MLMMRCRFARTCSQMLVAGAAVDPRRAGCAAAFGQELAKPATSSHVNKPCMSPGAQARVFALSVQPDMIRYLYRIMLVNECDARQYRIHELALSVNSKSL